ncbi:MAG: hypothetical protein QM723_20555 [Myxococcaceae bacterium]
MIHLFEERPEVRLGHSGPLAVSVWYNVMTDEASNALDRLHAQILKSHPKITILSVVQGAAKAPSHEQRERANEQARLLEPHRLGNFVVVLTSGLPGVITRTFLAGFTMLSKTPMTVLKSVDEAAEQIRKLPGQDPALSQNAALPLELKQFLELPRKA